MYGFNPLLDVSSLTDKELKKKIDDTSMRIAQVRAAGMPDSLSETLYSVLMSCEEELSMRMGRKQMEKFEDEDPCVFDMNSYLSSEDDEDKKQNESSGQQIYKSGW